MDKRDFLFWSVNPRNSALVKEVFEFPFDRMSQQGDTALCRLMSKYGSDKGSGWHNYTQLYHHLLERKRGSMSHVFELGLGTNNKDVPSNMGEYGKPGASLRAWRDYFPNALIWGADIDRRILFEDTRIGTQYCDQSSIRDVVELWDAFSSMQFGLMIDDGLHDFSANKIFLENSIHKLVDFGLYVIEDIVVDDRNFRKFQDLLRSLPHQSVMIKLPSDLNPNDNCVAFILKDRQEVNG